MMTSTYDAIVIGTGITGGWAAKELSEKGLKTIVLERGRDVKHGEYPTAMMESWYCSMRWRASALALLVLPSPSGRVESAPSSVVR